MKSFALKVKENFKKTAIFGGGVAVALGAQAAFAYDLSQGLEPFAKDINNVKIVVGAKAKPIDVVAAIDIAAALSALASKGNVVLQEEGELSSEGIVKLWKDNDKINIGEGFKLTSFDKNDFPKLLADGTLQSDTGTNYDYRQYIDVSPNDKFTYDAPKGDMDPELIVDLGNSNKDDPVIKYTLEFEDPVPFVIDSNGDGTPDKANPDLIGNKIEILGKTYVVSSETTPNKLVLYEAAKRVSLTKDKPVTVEIDGKKYEIKIVGFGQENGNDKVILNVNGDVDSIVEGNTKTIGGLTIYADSIWTEDNNKNGGAILLVGGKKLVLEDGNEVKVGENEDSIDYTRVYLNGGLQNLKSIEIRMWEGNNDKDFIEQGKTWTDPVFGQVSVYFKNVNSPLEDKKTRDRIHIEPSGSDELKVTIPTSDGSKTEKFVKMYKSEETVSFKLENDDDKPIYVVEGQPAEEDSYIFAPQVREVDGDYIPDGDYTVLLKVKNIQVDNTSTSDDYVEFEDVLTGDTYKTADFTWNGTNTQTIYIKGKKYIVEPVDINKDGEADKVKLYADDKMEVVYPLVKLEKGEEIGFYNKTVVDDNISDQDNKTLVLPSGTVRLLEDGKGNVTIVDYVNSGNNITVNSSVSKVINLNGFSYNFSVSSNKLYVNINGTLNPGLLLKEERLEGQSDLQRNILVFEAEQESGSNGDIAVKAPSVYTGYKSFNSNTDFEAGVTKYGTYVKVYKPDDNDGYIDVYYTDDELAAYVYLKGKLTKEVEGKKITVKPGQVIKGEYMVVGTTSGETNYLPLAVLDADPGAKTAKEVISVGGPCVNEVTKEFLAGTPYGSCKSWPLKEGQALIKYVEKGGRAALIIAGTKGEDTRNAVKKFLTDYKSLHGTEAVITVAETPNVEVSNQ